MEEKELAEKLKQQQEAEKGQTAATAVAVGTPEKESGEGRVVPLAVTVRRKLTSLISATR